MVAGRLAGRIGYALATIGLVALLAACGDSGFPNLPVDLSEGRVVGRVFLAGQPAAGVQVSALPPSVNTPGTVSTGPDGTFTLRAPAGQVAIEVGGAGTTTTRRTVTVSPNQDTDLGSILLEPRQGSPVAGNQPPSITAASVSSETIAAGQPVTVAATVVDSDSPDSLRVSAYAVDAAGAVLATAPLTLDNGVWVAPLILPASGTVRVVATDSPGSNTTVEATAGQVTVTS